MNITLGLLILWCRGSEVAPIVTGTFSLVWSKGHLSISIRSSQICMSGTSLWDRLTTVSCI